MCWSRAASADPTANLIVNVEKTDHRRCRRCHWCLRRHNMCSCSSLPSVCSSSSSSLSSPRSSCMEVAVERRGGSWENMGPFIFSFILSIAFITQSVSPTQSHRQPPRPTGLVKLQQARPGAPSSSHDVSRTHCENRGLPNEDAEYPIHSEKRCEANESGRTSKCRANESERK